MTTNWKDVLSRPAAGDHVAQLYQDPAFLIEALSHYVRSGLDGGEGVLLIMRDDNWESLRGQLDGAGAEPDAAVARGQLVRFGADETLGRLMKGGMPDREAFRSVLGDALGGIRTSYPSVRAFGEMVDILWQRGHRVGAQHLEALWNEALSSRGFSLYCAYSIDPLSAASYGGPIESVCKAHTHLIPARHYGELDQAVADASHKVLDRQLADVLRNLAGSHLVSTGMPHGQATLLWLAENMPRTAERILSLVRLAGARGA